MKYGLTQRIERTVPYTVNLLGGCASLLPESQEKKYRIEIKFVL